MTQKNKQKLQKLLTVAHNDYKKGLNACAFFKLNDKALCEDLVQSTFLKTWVYLVKGGEIETMKAFLYHILNNLIIDEYRKHKTTSLDVLLENGYEPGVDESNQLFNIIDGKEVIKLITNLPKKYQNIMNMKYVEDLSIKEMSEITGQLENTIAVQAHRGLDKLRFLYIQAQQV